jgi:hypothetical protein
MWWWNHFTVKFLIIVVLFHCSAYYYSPPDFWPVTDISNYVQCVWCATNYYYDLSSRCSWSPCLLNKIKRDNGKEIPHIISFFPSAKRFHLFLCFDCLYIERAHCILREWIHFKANKKHPTTRWNTAVTTMAFSNTALTSTQAPLSLYYSLLVENRGIEFWNYSRSEIQIGSCITWELTAIVMVPSLEYVLLPHRTLASQIIIISSIVIAIYLQKQLYFHRTTRSFELHYPCDERHCT